MTDVQHSDGNEDRGSKQDQQSDASETDCDLDETELKKNLRQALDDIKTFGSFASCGPTAGFSDPSITLGSDTSPIILPLQESDAQRLIAASHQAPFGKGAETIVDENVRKTWELNVDQFVVNNQHFKTTVRNAVNAAMGGLGVINIGQVEVAPYKMLLYEKGALFKPHTDTEKVPGQFATLIISLPSAHEGGDIIVSHKGIKRRITTPAMQSSYACWYSDVTHEVREVTSGYRLVLTYNIYRTGGLITLSANKIGEGYPVLKSALRDWRSSMGTEVVHILDHKYTDASLNSRGLKGADIGKFKALEYFAEKYEYEIFLASMVHMKSGEAEHEYDPWDRHGGYGRGRGSYYGGYGNYESDEEDEEDGSEGEFHAIDEVTETETKLRVIAPAGTEVIKEMIIDESCLLDEDAFDGERDPDDHEYEGYTGNAGAQSTHWYRDTVVVLVPRVRLTRWLMSGFSFKYLFRQDITPVLDWLRMRHNHNQGKTRATTRSDLMQLCNAVLEMNSKALVGKESPPFSQNSVKAALVYSVRLGDYHNLAKMLATSERLSNAVLKSLSSTIRDRFKELRDALTEAFGKIGGVNATFEGLAAIFGDNLDNLTGEAAEWASDVLTKAVSTISNPTEHDGKALVRIAVCLGRASFLRDCITVTIPRWSSRTRFVLAFLATLIKTGSHIFPEDEVLPAVRSCARRMIENFYLEPLDSQPHKRVKTSAENGSCNESTAGDTSSDISKVLEYLLENGLKANAESLLAALEMQVRVCQTEAIRQSLVPFLKHAQPLARQYAKSEYGPKFRSLYRAALEAFVQRFVKEQPETLENFARPRVNCWCQDCWQLNLCLISATQQECRFKVDPARRSHLHQILNESSADCTHETDRSTDTLVVKKTSKSKVDYSAWLIRCQEAGDQLVSFDPAILRDMLGDRYETIVGMRTLISDDTKVPDVVKAIWRQMPLAEKPNPPVQTGSKRKIEVIDLGSDDSD